MNTPEPEPLAEALRWLAQHAAFPRRRLSATAETMVCVQVLAAVEEAQEQQRFALQRRVPSQTSALKTHNLRRTQVHFKCDNSAKV
jgi:hypothetical protein